LGDLASFADELRRLWGAIPAYSPVGGRSWLTSGFGWRPSPFTGRREFHGGIDLAGPRGTRIVAPADGIVERAFLDDAAGLVVVLEHGNGIQTIYGHLDRVLVWEGKDVARGEPLGLLGNTGWRSTGPHLHYAVKVEGKYVNPRRYLFEKQNPAPRVAR
jgi:murein DD-endopeptidase MepM/ murein hydrolase activator NlpD